ncbi:hypothetical protein, partial [Phaeobacter italicus]|uniref:hypothetical protein n=1 Tax=Phaeobacter italicus TaxID=481446 RepID=UPI002FDA3B69
MSHLMLDPPCPKADQAEEYKTTCAAGERDRTCQPVQHLALPKQHDSAVPHDKGCDQLVSHKSNDIKFLIFLTLHDIKFLIFLMVPVAQNAKWNSGHAAPTGQRD